MGRKQLARLFWFGFLVWLLLTKRRCYVSLAGLSFTVLLPHPFPRIGIYRQVSSSSWGHLFKKNTELGIRDAHEKSRPEICFISVRASLPWEHGRGDEVLGEMSMRVDRGLAPHQKVQRDVGEGIV